MVPGRFARLPLGLLLFCLGALASAEDTPSAPELVADMASAYHNRTFQGRFLYMRGAEVSTFSLQHAVIDGKEYERLSHLTGRPTEVIRAGRKAVCIHPDSSVTRLPESADAAPFDLARKLLRQVPEQYDVLLDGDGRVAGRSAWRLRLAPLDGHRYGHRLWIDRDTGLLLKSELVDGGSVPLERVEFISLELDPQLTPEDFHMPVPDTGGAELPEPRAHTGIRVETGWLPGGFVPAARNEQEPLDGRQALASVTYSDGLATFTIFVEPQAAGVDEGISRLGPTVAVTRRLPADDGRYSATLVGEIPQSTAERILQQIRLREAAGD